MERSFSFVELMVVLIIIGLVSAMSVPSYARYIEKSRAKNAESNLITIYNMEKRYRLDNGNYYDCSMTPLLPCNSTTINLNLGTFVTDPYFNYTIINVKPNGYLAAATRNSGHCVNYTKQLSDSNNVIAKGACDYW